VPFRSAQDALENINSVSEGLVTDLLKTFLETHLPAAKVLKKADQKVGVAHHAIGAALADQLGTPCMHSPVVAELVRGIRLHFNKLIKSISETANVERAQVWRLIDCDY
jgi:nucleolar protein 56